MNELIDLKKISVIVPIYNVKQYLQKSIESILAQTYSNLEIILVDDGSTDGSSYLCDKFADMDNRIKVLHKQNGGLVSARKLGLEVATGEIIGFVDGDDWIEPNMYQYMLNVFLETDADIVDSGYYYEKENAVVHKFQLLSGVYDLDERNRHEFYQALLLNKESRLVIFPSIWSKIFRKDLIKRAYEKVPNNMSLGEDVISLIHCIINAKKICQVEKEFYHYVYRDTSIMNQKSVKFIVDKIILWNYCLELIKNNDIYIDEKECDIFLNNKIVSSWNSLYGDTEERFSYYRFPDLEQLSGKKIVIYGAGKVGYDYLLQLSKYCNCKIESWVDKNYHKIRNSYKQVEAVETLREKHYDYVIIGVLREEVAKEIKNELLKYQVPEKKILWIKPYTVGEIICENEVYKKVNRIRSND